MSTMASLLDDLERVSASAINAGDCIQQFRTDQLFGKLNPAEVKGFAGGLYGAGVIDGDYLTQLERTLADLATQQADRLNITGGTVVERIEDMSPDGRLSMCMDHEGDIHIKVIPSTIAVAGAGAGLEFVCHCPRSRHTLKALRQLMAAMIQDNIENPLLG